MGKKNKKLTEIEIDDNGYSKLVIRHDECDKCNKTLTVVCADNYYGTHSICQKCLNNYFEKGTRKLQTKNIDNLSTRLMRGADEGGID